MFTVSRLARFFPFLRWRWPDAALLRGEVMAGITVGLIVVPQSVAYAGLAGMPLVTGIYTAFLPALVAVLFGASLRLSVGATALTCLLVYASLSGLAAPGSPQWVSLAMWLSLLSGLMQIVLGVGRFGWVLQLVSSPVLTGFTQGAALLIVGSQLPAMLGAKGPLIDAVGRMMFDWRASAFGLGSLALLVLGKRFTPHFPMVMVCVLGAGALSWLTGFGASGGQVIGSLPSGLPQLQLPAPIDWQTLGALVVPAMVITLVSFLETASSAKAENQRLGRPWNENQDLMAQGLAKLASTVTGGFPTSASFSRSALLMYAGARTGWATVVTVLMVLLVLLWLTPALSLVPVAVLSAVVVAAVIGLMKPGQFVALWRLSPVEAGTAALTLVVTLLTAPRIYWGVLAGVLMGLTHFLYQRLHPRIIEVGLHPDHSLRDRHLWQLPPLAPELYALRMDAELDFAAASSLERNIIEHLAAHPQVRHVCVFAQPINRIDATGVEVFGQLRRALEERQVTLHLSGIKLPVETMLRRAGELPDSRWLRLYRTDTEALLVLQAASSAGTT
jgi:sulfate permease, SulP family